MVEGGVTQLHLAQNARYVLGTGLLVADDFLSKAVPKEDLAKIDTKAAYVVRIKKPIPAWFFLYGIGIGLAPEGGCANVRVPAKSPAELWGLGYLMRQLDSESKYKLRTDHILIDLKESEGRIVNIPTDEEVVKLHWCYQETFSANANSKKKLQHQQHHREDQASRMKRGLRALDRRRWVEGNMVPPPQRFGDLKKIQAAVYKKLCTDPTIDDSDEETAADLPPTGAYKDLFGDDSSRAELQQPDEGETGTGTEKTTTRAGGQPPSADQAPGSLGDGQKPRFVSPLSGRPAASRPKKKSLEEVLRGMQAQSRRQSRLRSGKRQDPYDFFAGGGEETDDMEL